MRTALIASFLIACTGHTALPPGEVTPPEITTTLPDNWLEGAPTGGCGAEPGETEPADMSVLPDLAKDCEDAWKTNGVREGCNH